MPEHEENTKEIKVSGLEPKWPGAKLCCVCCCALLCVSCGLRLAVFSPQRHCRTADRPKTGQRNNTHHFTR